MKRQRPLRRRYRSIVNAVLIVMLVLLPVGFVFQRLWALTEYGVQFHAAERDGVVWLRPLTRLLAELVDAQVAATAGVPVDISAVRAAVGEVGRVEQDHGDPLNIHKRWEPMPAQIDAVLTQPVSGADALAAYAVPIEMTQSLLGTIGDASMIVRDPGIDAYYLINTTIFAVPDVIVNAGRLAAAARDLATGPGPRTALTDDPRAAVALDRIARADEAIRIGPRSAADETSGRAAGIDLLKPLDAATAATGELVKAALAPAAIPVEQLAALDRARNTVQETALALENAALDSLDALLQQRLSTIAFERSAELVAGLAIGLAAVLLWLVNRSAGGPSPELPAIEIQRPDRPDRTRRRRPPWRPTPGSDGADHNGHKPAAAQPTGTR